MKSRSTVFLVSPLLLGLLTWTLGCSGQYSQQPGKPNVIIIYADDLDFDEIGVDEYKGEEFASFTGHLASHDTAPGLSRHLGYGEAKMHTPHIQRLAQEGAHFTRFYVTSSVCNPSRYSLLTGQYASRNVGLQLEYPISEMAMIDFNAYLFDGHQTIARILTEAGYATGMVGKWNLTHPHDRLTGYVTGVEENAVPTAAEVAQLLEEAYVRGQRSIKDYAGFLSAERIYQHNKEEIGLPRSLQVHNMEWVVEGALEFIDANKDRPFFLYIAPTIPHGWLGADMLAADPLATPRGMLTRRPRGMPSRSELRDRLKAAGTDPRSAVATWLDDGVGAVLAKLDELSLTENTIVIFSSDHQNRGKSTCYEGARVPFLIRWPARIAPATRVDALSANIDVAATILEATGARAPEDFIMDGRSLLPAVTGRADTDRRKALMLEIQYARAITTERWKYIALRFPPNVLTTISRGERQHFGLDGRVRRDPAGKPFIIYNSDDVFPGFFDADQLYDLKEDPYEQRNLAGDPERAKVLARMRSLLTNELRRLPHAYAEFAPGSENGHTETETGVPPRRMLHDGDFADPAHLGWRSPGAKVRFLPAAGDVPAHSILPAGAQLYQRISLRSEEAGMPFTLSLRIRKAGPEPASLRMQVAWLPTDGWSAVDEQGNSLVKVESHMAEPLSGSWLSEWFHVVQSEHAIHAALSLANKGQGEVAVSDIALAPMPQVFRASRQRALQTKTKGELLAGE